MAYTTYDVGVVTAGGSTHTKGAYVQVVASTPYASSRLQLELLYTSAARLPFLVDVATGAAAAETVVVANIATLADSDFMAGTVVTLDVDIPAGTRLAVRCQASTASAWIVMTVLLEDRALGSLAAPVTYGANTTNSRGTQIDPGGVANTKGSYVELSPSTSARIDAMVICCTQQAINVSAFLSWKFDVATGAGGAESIVVPDVMVSASSTADCMRPALFRLPVSIPASTRLAVRCQCTVTTADRDLRVTLIGMQEPASGGSASAVAYVG